MLFKQRDYVIKVLRRQMGDFCLSDRPLIRRKVEGAGA